MPNLDIVTFSYQIFKDFGCNVVLGGIIVWLLWKIATNHLKHIGDDVKTCITKIDNVSKDVSENKKSTDTKIDTINERVDSIGERISVVEGKTGIK